MARHTDSIYVQIKIAGPIDRVWQLTQTPELHQRWDLRFTEIRYLPRPDPAEPQRFDYATRIGFGLRIRGQGESIGHRNGPSGESSSALKFWSDDPKSLIREGSGYWKYVPSVGDGKTICFLTGYDYSVRFGAAGRLFDRMIFRPLIGWATAWSFDRLRLWVEKGIDPTLSLRLSLCYLAARLTLAIVWLYQGIVPKLVFKHSDEQAMFNAAGLTDPATRNLLIAVGWFELAVGLILIFAWRSLWPLWFTLAAMLAATLAVSVEAPAFLVAPFNPITLNLSVFSLAGIALLAAHDLPTARSCLRRSEREKQ